MALAITDDMIDDALKFHAAGVITAAAAGQPFLPDAIAEAAMAFKHSAFARVLRRRIVAAKSLGSALQEAEAALMQALAGNEAATKLIRQSHQNARPIISDEGEEDCKQSKRKRTLSIARSPHRNAKMNIKTRHAETIAHAWTVRHEIAALKAEVCRNVPVSTDSNAVAAAIASALHGCIKPAATRIRAALAEAERVNAAPPTKRPRRDSGGSGPDSGPQNGR